MDSRVFHKVIYLFIVLGKSPPLGLTVFLGFTYGVDVITHESESDILSSLLVSRILSYQSVWYTKYQKESMSHTTRYEPIWMSGHPDFVSEQPSKSIFVSPPRKATSDLSQGDWLFPERNISVRSRAITYERTVFMI